MKICVNGRIMLNRFERREKRHKGRHHDSTYIKILAVHPLFVLWLLCILTPHVVAAADGRAYIELDGGYKTGDFGTPTRSDLYYLAPVFGYVSPAYGFSVTAPYLWLTDETGGQSTTKTGIGDIFLRGDMVFIPEDKRGLSFDGTLAVKLPTADETKGLGTGETDYGISFGLHRRLEEIKLSFMAGYIKIGAPPSLNYNDIYLYGVGVSRVFTKTNLYASFEGRSSVISGAKNPQELNFGFFHVLSSHYSLKGNGFFGLNDGGPDLGYSVGLVRWF